MALRPPDSAVPIPPPPLQAEIPLMKQPKVMELPINGDKQQKQPANGENKAPVASSGEDAAAAAASVDYISSQDLTALPDPESKIQSLMEGLESKDWIIVCESLNDARRLALYHSDLLLPILDKVLLFLVKSMKNPRSALCKTSIMASSDTFSAYSDKLLEDLNADSFDQMLLQLLLKASQDKKFVCEEADRALVAMVASLTPLSLINKLRAYVRHSNHRVRAKAAVSISCCISKMGSEKMKEFGLVPLIQMAANLLNDRLPEAREAARSTVISIHDAVTESEEQKLESWQSFCETSLPPKQVQSIVKIISCQ